MKLKRSDITYEMIAEYYSYDPITGFVYKTKWMRGRSPGYYPHRTGYIVNKIKPYRQLQCFGHKFKEHHIAWLLHHKQWPTNIIDHRNGVKFDNRIDNLRLATAQQNVVNNATRVTNSTGFKGVSKIGKRYRVQIGVGNSHIHIGYYGCPYEAACVRMAAEIELYGDFAYQYSGQ